MQTLQKIKKICQRHGGFKNNENGVCVCVGGGGVCVCVVAGCMVGLAGVGGGGRETLLSELNRYKRAARLAVGRPAPCQGARHSSLPWLSQQRYLELKAASLP